MSGRNTRSQNGNGAEQDPANNPILQAILAVIQQQQAAMAHAEQRAEQTEQAHQAQINLMQQQMNQNLHNAEQQQAALHEQQEIFLEAQMAAQMQQMADLTAQLPVPQERPPPGIKQFRDLHPLSFAGTESPLEAAEFLRQTRDNLRAAQVPPASWVDIVKLQLTDVARSWWESEETRREHPIEWEIFEGEFDAKFFPPTARHVLEKRFMNLEQGDRTVDEYDAEFSRLQVYAPHMVADEAARVRHFRGGLRSEIRTHLSWGVFATHGNILAAARQFEFEQNMNRRPPTAAPRPGPAQQQSSSRFRANLAPNNSNNFKRNNEA